MSRILDCGRFGWPSLALVLGYCVVAWWPFAFWPRNHVSWLTGRAGLQFANSGIAYDVEPLPGSAAVSAPGQTANFTVELWFEADRVPANNVFHILTIHNGRLPSNFVLCQWKRGILVRVPNQNPQATRKTREIGVNGALEMQRARFITISGNEAGTDFYLDGVLSEHFPRFVLNADALRGRLILGNAANGKHSWAGRVFGLAVYQRALDAAEVAKNHAFWMQGHARQLVNAPGLMALYLFDESNGQRVNDLSNSRHTITIPTVYDPPHKDFLTPLWREHAGQKPGYRDIVTNILGFIPFGFCYYLHRRSSARNTRLRNAWRVVLVGAVVSLALETVQVWLPNRVSSMTDLVCNAAGTLLGVMLALAICFVAQRTESRLKHPC